MNSAHSTSASTISSSGTTAHDLALHEQVAPLAAGGDAEVGVARLAGPVHDAAHHRDLERDLAVAERGLRVVGHLDHVDLGPPARSGRR